MLDKHQVIEDRGYSCECGCGRRGEDLHHWFYKSKNFPELNCDEGVVLITHKENVDRKYDNPEGRKLFWKVQRERYGESHMIAWLDALPEKLQGRVQELKNELGIAKESK